MGNYFAVPNNFGIIQYDHEAFAAKYYAFQAEIAAMKKCKRFTQIIQNELYEASVK